MSEPLSNMAHGKVLIFAGPHGAGKDTLEALFTQSQPRATRIVRHITRPVDPDETDGKDYYFIDDGTFNGMADREEFIEYAAYVGCMSGTSLAEVKDKITRSEFASLTANFKDGFTLHRRLGALAMSNICFFISPCSREVMQDDPNLYLSLLRERMTNRGRSSDLIEGRLFRATQYRELYLANEADAVYINNSNGRVEDASRDIIRIALANTLP